MKLLIDENLPKRLKNDFQEYEIYTVRDMGWNSKRNGELLKLMMENRFDVLFTFDKGIEFQQNFERYPVAVFILNAEDNTYLSLRPLVPSIQNYLKNLKSGPTQILP